MDCTGTAFSFYTISHYDVPAGSRSFPHDIIQAARLEGLSEIRIFFTMFLPIMKSTYGAAMTVTFMNAWNNYLWPTIILQDSNQITMPMLVANLKSGYSVDYGMLMLGGIDLYPSYRNYLSVLTKEFCQWNCQEQ